MTAQIKNLLHKTFISKKGFTLIEILVAIGVLGIIGGVVITSAAAVQRNARDGQRKGDLKKVQAGLQQYYTDQSFYPDASFNLSTASQISYPPKIYLEDIPHDPVSTDPPYCYQAYSDSTKTAACDNTSAVPANHCHYYSLYTKLEGGASPSFNCGGDSYNLEVNPS